MKEALKQALEALRYHRDQTRPIDRTDAAIAAAEAALAAPHGEPAMPSITRYTVAVEGQALTYWDNVHDAITTAQRAVYAGVDTTTRAIDDLQAGRLAEWSYGFGAVRIYPPQMARPEQYPGQWEPGCDLGSNAQHAQPAEPVQPVQEPYAWMAVGGSIWRHKSREDDVPLYTAPPARQPLTQDEMFSLVPSTLRESQIDLIWFGRAVERAHKIGCEA